MVKVCMGYIGMVISVYGIDWYGKGMYGIYWYGDRYIWDILVW